MTSVKTAISLPADIFDGLDRLATQTGESRSAVVAAALRRYLKDEATRQFMAQMNAVYADTAQPLPDPGWKERHRRLRADEAW